MSSSWESLGQPIHSKGDQPIHSKGDQSWVFFGRTDAKAETPVLWPPHAKSWLIGKESDSGRDWGQEEKGMTEDEMAGWHHRLDGREFEWTLGDGDGQRGLACCNSWGCKESDTTEWLNRVGIYHHHHHYHRHPCYQPNQIIMRKIKQIPCRDIKNRNIFLKCVIIFYKTLFSFRWMTWEFYSK